MAEMEHAGSATGDNSVKDESAESKVTYLSDEDMRKRQSGVVSFIKELPMLILVALVVAWFIKTLIVQPFFIPSASMEPTFIRGDHVLVNKFIYRFVEPRPGDVIVFKYPVDMTVDYIKRVVAVEGQRVEIKSGTLYIDGKAVKEPYLSENSKVTSDFGPVTIKKDSLFVMGDNRNNSSDSRVWGMLPEENLIGKAFVIYWPPSRVDLVR